MEYELIVSERSDEEARTAVEYYDQISPSLGERFFVELLEIYQKLAISPQFYSFISSTRASSVRDIKFPSFPYVVIFRVWDDKVYVISVRNSYKRPLFS